MEVIKIGGSLLSNVHDIENFAEYISSIYLKSNSIPVIVISAFKNHTDELIKMSSMFGNTPSSTIITAGEQITAGLLEMALQNKSIKAKALMGWQVPILVGQSVSAKKDIILNFINQGIVPIVAGFQGIDESNNIKDLGRGGSDLTAICLAKELNTQCVLLKKYGGICSADPQLIKDCFVWESVGYDNLLSLAESGSPVIQKEALIFAKNYNVNICISNLDGSSKTNVNHFNEKFWNLFLYNKKIRLISYNKQEKLANLGFDLNNSCYEHKENFDENNIMQIYQACFSL